MKQTQTHRQQQQRQRPLNNRQRHSRTGMAGTKVTMTMKTIKVSFSATKTAHQHQSLNPNHWPLNSKLLASRRAKWTPTKAVIQQELVVLQFLPLQRPPLPNKTLIRIKMPVHHLVMMRMINRRPSSKETRMNKSTRSSTTGLQIPHPEEATTLRMRMSAHRHTIIKVMTIADLGIVHPTMVATTMIGDRAVIAATDSLSTAEAVAMGNIEATVAIVAVDIIIIATTIEMVATTIVDMVALEIITIVTIMIRTIANFKSSTLTRSTQSLTTGCTIRATLHSSLRRLGRKRPLSFSRSTYSKASSR